MGEPTAGIEPDAAGHQPPTAPVVVAAVEPREHFISTAITFLQNPGVRRNPLNQKQQFLRSKGLTEDEIQIACDRAGVFTGTTPDNAASGAPPTVLNMGIRQAGVGHQQHGIVASPPKSLLQYVRDVASASALVAGVAYAIYMFYKNYIRPLLFGRDSDASGGGGSSTAAGRKRRRKTPEELMEDMSRSVEKSVASITQELQRVREEVARTARQDALHREIGTFKADLDAIKGLLLNTKQFSSPVLPPSIPAWQLQVQQQQRQAKEAANAAAAAAAAAAQTQQTQADQSGTSIEDLGAEALALGGGAQSDDIEEMASGSGSSETEVVNKNSDSSIELI